MPSDFAVDMLTDEEAGKLLKALVVYSIDQTPLESKDRTLQMAFCALKGQIDRDFEHSQKISKVRSEAVNVRWKKNTKEYKRIQKNTNVSKPNTIEKRKNTFGQCLIPFVEQYGKVMIREFFDYWTEPNKSKTKMRYELEKTWDLSRRLRTWASKIDKYGTDRERNTKSQRLNDAAAIIQRLAAEDDAREA